MKRKPRLGSLFSGIGGFDLGFEKAGWETAWQIEREPFCQAILKTRFPKAELFDDVKEVGAHNLKRVDCITAGVPCQDVSTSGKRAGLSGACTGLFYDFARILRELRPSWFVFENVPGLFSSNEGRDFAEILRVLMVECGYGVCWRMLDSRFFGVAQNRHRVFIVGSFGKPCPAEILFERFNLGISISKKGAFHTNRPILRAYGGGFDYRISSTLTAHAGFAHDNQATWISDSQINAQGIREVAGLPLGLDGARYKALGNAVTVPVVEWIGRRILETEGKR